MSLPEVLGRLRGSSGSRPAPLAKTTIASAAAGGFLGILVVALTGAGLQITLLLGSFAASCVLLFGYPEAAFVQPANAVFGHLISAPATPHPSPAIFDLLPRRRSIAGSAIGGIAETQEMLDFCAARKIVCDIEMMAMQDIEQAYGRLLKGDVRHRFVVDMQTPKQ